MDLEHDAYKQIKAVVRESLLPQECKMKYITNRESTLRNDKPAIGHVPIVINAA